MSGRRHKAKRRKQHLYLAFDDGQSGYTIRKVRLSPGSASDSGEGILTRIWAPHARGLPRHLTSAFGTKIVALHIGESSRIKGIPIIDVKDQSFFFGPHPNYPACPIYFPISDDRLFALDIGTFDFFFGKPDTAPWVWHELTYPPFRRHEVSSYAIQPDGCILVSTKSDATAAAATYIFDTEKYVWELYGDWALPFTGCGHYTPSLDAFVGLSSDPETLGYLYSCTMASTGTGDTGNILHPSPECKCSKETVYSKNPAERHVGATLVHMGRDKFCLVECVDTRLDEELLEPVTDEQLLEPGTYYEELLEPGTYYEEPRPAVGDRFMYRLKTFSLRYDANGDLKLEHHQVRCYSVPHETTIDFIIQDPVAFWL